MPNINPIVLKTVSGGGGGGINYSVEVFTSSGTYTKPVDLDYAYVLMVGGGGGASSGRRGAANSNRGGGAAYNGALALLKYNNSELASTRSVTVGAGGVGGSSQTTNDTNGINGTSGSRSEFGGWPNVAQAGQNRQGIANVVADDKGGLQYNITSHKNVLLYTGNSNILGTTAVFNRYRGNSCTFIDDPLSAFNCCSCGGQINSSNTQFKSGTLGGFYNDSNVLTDEITGTLPETGNGVQPSEFYTFGQFLAKMFSWFDPLDANYNIGRGGLGGGCGDTSGTIAGGNGANALGYGAGGGGGGASTNGANSGAGGNGSPGIVIIINVLTS